MVKVNEEKGSFKALTLDEFHYLVDRVQKYYAELSKYGMRWGQAYMNVLAELHGNMYNEITAMHNVDPFYKDEYLYAFLRYIGDEEVHGFLNIKYNYGNKKQEHGN
jgi:hypothetical protein